MAPATPKKPSTATARKAAAKPAASDAAADADESTPATAPAALRLKELLDRVTASTGGKKKGVREIVEATLTQLGLALQNGEMLNLPALGKVRVAKGLGGGPGTPLTLKLRRGEGAKKKPADGPLAEPADQG